MAASVAGRVSTEPRQRRAACPDSPILHGTRPRPVCKHHGQPSHTVAVARPDANVRVRCASTTRPPASFHGRRTQSCLRRKNGQHKRSPPVMWRKKHYFLGVATMNTAPVKPVQMAPTDAAAHLPWKRQRGEPPSCGLSSHGHIMLGAPRCRHRYAASLRQADKRMRPNRPCLRRHPLTTAAETRTIAERRGAAAADASFVTLHNQPRQCVMCVTPIDSLEKQR